MFSLYVLIISLIHLTKIFMLHDKEKIIDTPHWDGKYKYCYTNSKYFKNKEDSYKKYIIWSAIFTVCAYPLSIVLSDVSCNRTYTYTAKESIWDSYTAPLQFEGGYIPDRIDKLFTKEKIVAGELTELAEKYPEIKKELEFYEMSGLTNGTRDRIISMLKEKGESL